MADDFVIPGPDAARPTWIKIYNTVELLLSVTCYYVIWRNIQSWRVLIVSSRKNFNCQEVGCFPVFHDGDRSTTVVL